MKKTGKLAIYLLVGGVALLTSLHASAAEKSPAVEKDWVETCIEKHPEVLWLADKDVRKTEEGTASSEMSHSERLFGQKFVEFDQTMMTIRCLQLLVDGSPQAYWEFTKAQPEGVRLSRESFRELHRQADELLESGWEGMTRREMAQVMEAALVLGDMGKSAKAREKFKAYGITAPDHDDFYGEAMQLLEKHPSLCPSFASLSPAGRKLLVMTSKVGHFGHMTHLEGSENMFCELRENALCPWALSFALFTHTCDVAGALGHVNNQSSLVYTELTHKAMQAMGKAVRIASRKVEKEAYDAYLETRASWLGLDPADRMDRVLTRLGAMLRLFTPEEGAALRAAVAKLDSADRERIIAQLDGKQEGRTPTYVPAVLVNLCNNKTFGENGLQQAVLLGLPLISKVLEKHQELLKEGKADPAIPLNFNPVAGAAKTDPQTLLNDFTIDKEGNVTLSPAPNEGDHSPFRSVRFL